MTTLTVPRGAQAVRPWRRWLSRHRGLRALPFMAPWLIGFAVFFAYPLVSTVWFSFTPYDQINPPTWVGLRNWKYILELGQCWQALTNTAWLVVVMVTLRVVSGLGLGVLVTQVKRGAGLLRTVL